MPIPHARIPSLRLSALAALSLASPSTLAHANDWPCWRGPDRDNVSKETDWSSQGHAEPTWSADIGRGYSVPTVVDGRVFAVGYFENPETPREGVDRITCLNAGSGDVIWSLEFPASAYDNEHEGGVLSTPTVLGDTLFVASRGGEVRSLNAADGTLHWKVNLVERHEVDPERYGFSSSPFVYGDQIVLNAERTVALDQATGETRWISDNYEAHFSTVTPITIGEREGLVVFGREGLVVIDGTTGEHVSTYPFRVIDRNVEGATPIVFGEKALISSGYDQGIALVDFSGPEPVEVWRNRRMRTKMAGCTVWEGHLYGFDESMLKCLDLDGKELWRKRGLGHGALSIAGGRLLITTSDGELVVAQATSEGYREEARRDLIDGGVFWAPPILVNGHVFFRGSEGQLLCIDHRGAPAATEVAAAAPTAESGPLPTPAALLERHVAAAGRRTDGWNGLTLAGTLQNDSLGLGTVEAEWTFGPASTMRERFRMAPYPGHMDRYFDGEVAWEQSPMRGVKPVEDEYELAELRNTRGLRTFVAPLDVEKATGVVREELRGIDCYRVDERIDDETVRQVYFDTQTGFYVGRTAEREATVLFSDWREVDGAYLPFERRTFDADNGEEWRWRFETATFGEIEADFFARPDDLNEDVPADGEDVEDEETDSDTE